MTEEDIIKYYVEQGYDSAETLKTFNNEVVYHGTYKKEFGCWGFPLLVTIRNNEIYEYTRTEVLQILATL